MERDTAEALIKQTDNPKVQIQFPKKKNRGLNRIIKTLFPTKPTAGKPVGSLNGAAGKELKSALLNGDTEGQSKPGQIQPSTQIPSFETWTSAMGLYVPTTPSTGFVTLLTVTGEVASITHYTGLLMRISPGLRYQQCNWGM